MVFQQPSNVDHVFHQRMNPCLAGRQASFGVKRDLHGGGSEHPPGVYLLSLSPRVGAVTAANNALPKREVVRVVSVF